MAVLSPLIREVSDLIIGKPALKPLPHDSTVGDALAALRRSSSDSWVSVWATDRSTPDKKSCVGKVSVVDVVCFLCEEGNICKPTEALSSPVSELLRHKKKGAVRRVEPHCSILEALDLILYESAQNLVVPIRRRKSQNGGGAGEFCWLSQENFVRFFLNSISFFSPVPALSIVSLGLIRPEILAVRRGDPAISAVPLLRLALSSGTSVAVLSDDGTCLTGEISPSALSSVCDQTAAPALAALSAGDLIAFIDCCPSPPEAAFRAVESKLTEKNLTGMLELLSEEHYNCRSSSSSSSSSSSDEGLQKQNSSNKRRFIKRQRSIRSYSARMSEEAIVCHPESSLVAVMVQALAHRVTYIWVVDDDYAPAGIVTFPEILKLFRELLQ